MNLEYLRSFYITVKCNSISKAAKQLNFTQPGLSMQLQNLENELGVKLLERSHKGVELTEEGKVVYDYADSILSMQNNIVRDLKNLQSDNNQLIIGACESVGDYALPCSIYTFKHLHKEVNINMEVTSSLEVIGKLRDHTINIGIIDYNPKEDDISTQTIVSDELVLVGNCKNTPTKISLEKLMEIPLILSNKNSATGLLVEKALQEQGISLDDLNVIYTLNSLEAIKTSVFAGKGFSFLPKLSVKQTLKEHCIKPIIVEGLTINFDYNVASRKKYKLTNYEQKFVNFIISSKRGFC